MSFYGSVYYQLVDTFYKVVAKNTGKDNLTFIVPNKEAELPNQAVGRKGVIELDSGNRWINFSDAGAEDSAAYKIWHGKPDTEIVTPDHGFKLLNVSEADITDRTKDGVIQLIAADEFETYETQYDKAGHIAETIRKVYRLPKSETDERLDKLEDAVGKDIDKTQFILPEIKDENKQHLYGYVEQNTTDIQTLEKHVGTWEGVVNTGVPNAKYSITAVIGDMNDLLGEGFIFDTNFKSLTQVLGTLKDLDEADLYTSEEKPTNIIDGLVKLQKALKALNSTVGSNKETSDGQTNGIWSAIGEKIDNESIYDHIKTIYGDDNGNVTDSLTTLANRAQSLEDKDKSLGNDIKIINDKLDWSSTDTVSKAVTDIKNNLGAGWTSTNTVAKAVNDINTNLGTGWSSTNTVNKAISDINTNLGTGWSSANTVSKAIADINSKMGWERTTSSVLSDVISLENRAKDLETHKTNSEKDIQDLQDDVAKHYENTEDSKSNSELSKRIDSVVAAIGDLPENTSAAQRIIDVENNFNTAIGTVPENSNVMAELNTAFENIENLIGEVPTDSTVMQELVDSTDNLQEQINTLTANLGTVTEGTNAYSLINKNIKDISDVNTKIGTNTDLIAQQGNSIILIQQNYMTKTEAAGIIGDISSWENPDNTIASKINSLEGVINEVNNVIGDVSEVEEKTLVELLLEMKAEIAEIKTVINTLHPDGEPPFPDMSIPELPPEEEPTPDSEEPGESENGENVNPEDELENESSGGEEEPNE